jgi:hypothetical protein
MSGLIHNRKHGEEIPAAFLQPEHWNGKIVLWVFPQGKAGLFQADGNPAAAVKQLVEAGVGVMGVDLFRQGEFLKPGEKTSDNPRVQYPGKTDKPDEQWRLSGVYFYGYNDSLFTRRVHDILTCVSFVRNYEKRKVKSLALIGLEGAGPWAVAVAAVAGPAIDQTIAVTNGFRFAKLDSSWDQHFLPGAAKYGDIGAFPVLTAPQKLWLLDSDATLRGQVQAAYTAAGAADGLTLYQGEKGKAQADWLRLLVE